MKKSIVLSAFVLTFSAMPILAANNAPLWLRNTAISPDGTTIAFTYKGDVYTVDAGGGVARQLTSDPAYDTAPAWSPDGSKIAFESLRDGSKDVFIVGANGGTPQRLTTNSGDETVRAWLNDSTVLFQAQMMPSREDIYGAFKSQTYTVSIKPESRPKLFLSLETTSMSVNADGAILYEDKKGFENVWRKHEKSSSTADVYLWKNGEYTRQTTFGGNDRNPVWSGGDSYVYLSEEDGTLNIYRRKVNSTDREQLTKFATHPVRHLSASADGSLLAFSYDGEIYTLRQGGQPEKVNVTIIADDYDSDLVRYVSHSDATAMDVADSSEEVAFVIRGDVYATSVKYKTTKQITNTSAQERNVSFSADGRSIVYDSDRDGIWQLFIAKIEDEKDKTFTYASSIIEEPLYRSEKTAQQPVFSPDGTKVAFLEDRTELRVIDVKTKEVKTVLEGKYNYSYADGDITFAWSPDSRWLLIDYIGVGGWNNTDIALVSADASQPVIDLTESGYVDHNAKWVLGGKGVAYATGKYGMRSHGSWGNQNDVMLMLLDGEAWDKFNMTEEESAIAEKLEKEEKEAAEAKKDDKKDKKDKKKKGEDVDKAEPLKLDIANRRYRMRRLTGMSSSLGDYFLSPKGDKFYYMARAVEGQSNLFERDLRKDETKVLVQGVNGSIVPDKKGENIYLLSYGGIKKVELSSGKVEAIEFEAQCKRRPSLEREYIYGHAWQQVKDKFYDENIHGIDWNGYGEHYRKFLPYINNNVDFAIMLSELLGELNASHTGASAYASKMAIPTASLGAFFDQNYEGDGLLITEILPRGPLASPKAALKAGDVILAIDGVNIVAGKDYTSLLDGKIGKKVRLTVDRRASKASGLDEVAVVKPISAGAVSNMLYQRWVENNEAMVDSLSDGRIGYVHVEGMDSESFRTVFDRLLGKYRNYEAVVVDTRFNGGGWLHNDIAQLLSGREYVRFTPRGKYIGSEPFSQWTKPSVMLVNEANYSDAHGTPYTYQTLKIGDVVGAPVPGTMTAVWWEYQIDPSIVFGIPQVTSLDIHGEPLENKQLTPDVVIYNNPNETTAGIDRQLEGAVAHLLKSLPNKK